MACASLPRYATRPASTEIAKALNVASAVALMKDGGEVVAIIPRSFCNGPYYQSFRRFILRRAAIRHTAVSNAIPLWAPATWRFFLHCRAVPRVLLLPMYFAVSEALQQGGVG